MDKIISLDQLCIGINSIKSYRKGFLTNFYLDTSKHQHWIDKGIISSINIGNTFFIIKENSTFWNVFYNTFDVNSLQEDLKQFCNMYSYKKIVFDVVGKQTNIDNITPCFSCNGLAPLKRLIRLSKTAENCNHSYDNIEYASLNDIQELQQLLTSNFNIYFEQLPDDYELKMLIENKGVLIQKENTKICAFVIFEKTPTTLYLRYWFVSSDYRGRGTGSKLLRMMFKQGETCKRLIHWCLDDNSNALVRYLHYGYKEDGLIDQIYSNIKIN